MMKIAKYDLEGNFLEILEEKNLTEISRNEKVNPISLKRAISGTVLSVNNFQYRLVDSNIKVLTKIAPVYTLIKGPYILNKSLMVAKYYKGKLITTYKSLSELCKKNNIPDMTTISKNLRNGKEHNTRTGFTFKKIN